MLARKHGIAPENVCVTNGATEAIYLIAMLLKRGCSYIAEPTFSEYRDACLLHGHNISEQFIEGVNTYWLCNPNNPTGNVVPKEDIVTLTKEFHDVTFVLDESYAKFTNRRLLSPEEGIGIPNLIMIHSLTKHFAIPGLRIGYITGDKDIVTALKQMRMPWSVNAMAQEAAIYLLDQRFPEGWFEEKLADAKVLGDKLTKIGIEVRPSDTHFLLCSTPSGSSLELKEWLVKEKGLLIRDASNFRGLSARHFRVASQGRIADAELTASIKEWLDSYHINTTSL